MNRLFILVSLIIFQVVYKTSFGQNVLINEVVSNNFSGIQDEDGDFSDWIELYNSGETPVNLSGYFLSDKPNSPYQWMFPSVEIPAQGFLVVFSSGKDRYGEELHSNFKISAEGEELLLTNNEGVLIDQIVVKGLADNESFGRLPDGSIDFYELYSATPGTSNNSNNVISFSHPAGFYEEAFHLSISSLNDDTMFYTLDGSVPTPESEFYIEPFFLEENLSANFFSEIRTTPDQHLIGYKSWESPGVLVDKCRIIRCASFRQGNRSSKIYSSSYFIDKSISTKYSLPVISLITEGNNLFSADSGIYVPGNFYNPANPEWTGNYFQRGKNWERPVHLEYFNLDGTLEFSQDAGVRIHGGKTRNASQKSLRLYARNEYGEKYFNYPLFPQKSQHTYKRFILRTTMGSWHDQSMIKDAFAHDAVRDLDLDYQDFQAVIVFLNGEYWGIHDMRERIDEKYIAYNYNYNEEFIEFDKPNNENYDSIKQFLEANELLDEGNYEFINSQLDIPSYIDYYIAEMFFTNYDWPANNNDSWRNTSPPGKWRPVFFDLDGGLADAEYNMFYHLSLNDDNSGWPNSAESTLLFRSLIRNENFLEQFINRYAEILNSEFDIEILQNKLQTIKEMYAAEVPDHIRRWNFPNSFSNWENDVDKVLTTFIKNRPCVVEKNIIEYFNLKKFDFTCLENDPESELSGLIVAPNPGNGFIFLFNKTSEPVNADVSLLSISGKMVSKAEGVIIESGERYNFNYSHLAAGTYILRIIQGAEIENKRIVIY